MSDGDGSSDPAMSETRTQLRGSAGLALGRVISLLIGLAVQVLTVRALTKSDYGAFAYALSLVPVVRLIVSLGTTKATSRFLALYRERGDSRRLVGIVVLQAFGFVFLGLCVWLALMAGDEWVSDWLSDEVIQRVLLILVLLGPVEALDDMFEGFFATFGKARAIFIRKYVLAPVIKLIAVVAVFVTTQDPIHLAVGYLAGGVIGSLTYVGMALRILRENQLLGMFRPGRFTVPVKELLVFSIPLLSGEALYLSMNALGVIVLEQTWGADAVAEYRAVFPLARLNHFVMWAFAVLFVPLAARFYERQDASSMRDAYWRTAAWIAVFTFPVYAMTGPLAGSTSTLLFGDEYSAAGPVLAVLGAGYYLNAVFAFNALTLQTYGHVRFVSVVNVVAAIGNAGLIWTLGSRFGTVGVAAANAFTFIGINAANQIALHRVIRVGLGPRGMVDMYLRIGVITALLWGGSALNLHPVALVLVAAVSSIYLVRASRPQLQADAVLPELARLPVLRWLL